MPMFRKYQSLNLFFKSKGYFEIKGSVHQQLFVKVKDIISVKSSEIIRRTITA